MPLPGLCLVWSVTVESWRIAFYMAWKLSLLRDVAVVCVVGAVWCAGLNVT